MWLGCNSNFRSCLDFHTELALVVVKWRMIYMRVPNYWLEYDSAALAFLVLGIAAVGLLALIV